MDLGPIADRRRGEAADKIELQIHRMTLLVERNSGHEGHLVLRTPSGFTASALPAEVGIIELNGAAQTMGSVLQGHGTVDLLVQQPGRGIAHPELTFEGQGRRPRLGLADQVDREKPGRQRQLGVLHQAACGDRSLMAAAVALEQFARTVADNIVIGACAARTPKTVRPTRLLDGLGALRLGAEAVQELGNRDAALELNSVESHGALSVLMKRVQVMTSQAHGMSLAEAGFQSGEVIVNRPE